MTTTPWIDPCMLLDENSTHTHTQVSLGDRTDEEKVVALFIIVTLYSLNT